MPTLTTSPARPTSRGAARVTEQAMVAKFAQVIGTARLAPADVTLASGSVVHVDGVADDGSVFVEAHAVTAPIRDIDLAIIAQDVFKLSLARSVRPQARAVVLLADEDVRRTVAARIARTPVADSVELLVVSPHD